MGHMVVSAIQLQIITNSYTNVMYTFKMLVIPL